MSKLELPAGNQLGMQHTLRGYPSAKEWAHQVGPLAGLGACGEGVQGTLSMNFATVLHRNMWGNMQETMYVLIFNFDPRHKLWVGHIDPENWLCQ